MISVDYANKVFLDLLNPNLSSFNTLIKCSIGKSDKIAASAYNRMRKLGISSDSLTFKYLLKSFGRLESGEMLHGHVIKFGLIPSLVVMNTLLDFYAKHGGSLGIVRKLFDEMPKRDGASWDTIIRVHMSCGEVDCAMRLLNSMPERHLAPWNSVVCGLVNRDINNVELAYKVFKRLPRRNIASWNAMIQGLVNNHMYSLAFSTFNDMLARCKPDETTLITMLSVCSQLLLVEQGKWLASYVEENNLSVSLPLGNALIDMFLSTKDVRNASIIFKKMPKRCLITWRKMIYGLGSHGFGQEALELFDTMCSQGQKPDGAILTELVGVFTFDECLLGDGKRLFGLLHQMVHDFGIKPTRDDYRMMVNILSAAGWVEAAVMLIESMFWEPCPFAWGRVLSACKIYGYENLLESSLIKISKMYCGYPKISYLKKILFSMISNISTRRKHNDPNDLKLMMESLIKMLIFHKRSNDPNDQKWMDLLTDLNKSIDWMQNTLKLEDQYPDRCSLFQAQETSPPEEICRALESLHKQIALHVKNDPCQDDGFVDM